MDSQQTMRDAAIAWARAGFYVFPCTPQAKTPGVEHGVNEATRDEAQIIKWWTQNPDFNIGVAPARSSMSVLDVDPPLGQETLAQLCSVHGALPGTLTVRTPRGGLHYWFTGDLPSTVGKLGPKLDTRGIGGYVLVPPSVVNNNPYTYEGDEDAIAQAPAWIGKALEASREVHHAEADVELDTPLAIQRASEVLRTHVQNGLVAVEGQGGDNRTYQTIAAIRDLGLSEDVAFELLCELWNPSCVPPWTREELRVKLDNVYSYAQNEAGSSAIEDPAISFAHFAGIAETGDVDSGNIEGERTRFYPMDEGEMDALPEPSWLLPNVLPAQAIGMLYGPYETFKSFLTLDLALTLASGVAGWGADPREPMTVVYACGEGARETARKRRPAWKTAHFISDPLPLYLVDDVPMVQAPKDRHDFIAAIRKRGLKPALVILDTAALAMVGLNENDAKDAGLMVQSMKEIKRAFNCSVLAVHHMGKDRERGARGSSALPAGLDFMLEVKADTDTKMATVRVKKQKDADKLKTPFAFQGQVCGPSLAFFEIPPEAYKAMTNPDDPFSPKHVGEALRALGALSEQTSVSRHVLATQMCPPLENETQEARARAINSFTRKLGLLAKSKLTCYAFGENKNEKWFIPALADDAPAEDEV